MRHQKTAIGDKQSQVFATLKSATSENTDRREHYSEKSLSYSLSHFPLYVSQLKLSDVNLRIIGRRLNLW